MTYLSPSRKLLSLRVVLGTLKLQLMSEVRVVLGLPPKFVLVIYYNRPSRELEEIAFPLPGIYCNHLALKW